MFRFSYKRDRAPALIIAVPGLKLSYWPDNVSLWIFGLGGQCVLVFELGRVELQLLPGHNVYRWSL